MKHLLITGALCIVCMTSVAQYTGPSTATTVTSIKQLFATGQDDQYLTLQGRPIAHNGGKDYMFADEGDQMRVEIPPHLFPAAKPVGAGTRAKITGKFDKEWVTRQSELEVHQLIVLE